FEAFVDAENALRIGIGIQEPILAPLRPRTPEGASPAKSNENFALGCRPTSRHVVVVFQAPSGQSCLAGIQGNLDRVEKKVLRRVQDNFWCLLLGDRSPRD